MFGQIEGPSGLCQSPSFGSSALDMTHDSSAAHLGLIFSNFCGKARAEAEEERRARQAAAASQNEAEESDESEDETAGERTTRASGKKSEVA